MTNKEKTRKITITVTASEVDAVEDMFWCQNNAKQMETLYPYLNSFWMKLADAFDYYDDVDTVPYEVDYSKINLIPKRGTPIVPQPLGDLEEES